MVPPRVERTSAETQMDISTVDEIETPVATASTAGVAVVGTLATAAAVVGRSRRKTKVARKGLQTSPGYNTLPEMDKKNNGFEGVIGDQAPLGYWDPLGFSKDGDAEKFKRRREIEIKHGRIAMFATIGYIVPEYFKFDGYLSPSENIKFSDVPNGLAALSKVPVAGWGQILAFIGLIELVYNKGSPEPGNFGKGYFGLGSVGLNTNIANPGARANKLKVELANGRLAMMAIIGMFFQDGLTGSAWGDWSLYTASPLRAFEDERGVQPPLGFWDPLGFTQGGNVEAFKRRRASEIKHGRICMLATMGYITPEITGKFPGYLSPSTLLKYDDIPNGLGAISKVPALGWAQIFVYCGYAELSQDQTPGSPGAEGNFGFKVLTSSDPDSLEKKLASEIANGRLAMMAFTGMATQDGLTGSAWGDWALYTDSPLRAFEGELGVTPPMGYFDPLGLSSDGDKKTFIRRRKSELKNGRVAMWACMGWIVPEWYRFPGELSPSSGLKFSEIPNGMAALKALPTEAWAQMGAFVALLELGPLWQDESRAPGDFKTCAKYGFPMFFVGGREGSDSDPVKNQYSLNSEINNGRLAMMAITGMVFQNGITGTTGPEMWAVGAFESERGVQAPVGFFDPLGFTKDGSVENFNRRRASEIKHGRICMLATMGYMTPELTGKFPGYLSPSLGLKYADIPNGLGAVVKIPAAGWIQIFAYAGFAELSQDQKPGSKGATGDFGFLTGLLPEDDAGKERKFASELANGRLAMMALMGMMFQDGLTGSAYGDWALYTDSPLRAFEEETGVQPPLGFWDPLGYTSNANLFDFKRRREVELKHGRVAMFATMGYIAPEYFRFEGYCSPSYGVKFADVPNGFAALGTVPALGWFQIVLFAGLIEITIYNETVNDEPGNYGAGNLGLRTLGVTTQIADPESRKKKLNAELANGRLAMMAIIGMFFQEGLTGSAWGDWANYTESPLRAFENELGVQPPVGFWDPLGYTRTGDVEAFKRRRETEIKHGRVAMYATIGYIVPEYFRWPGELQPSTGLKFDDIPNGLAAISKVPAGGWTQIVAFLGFYELSVYPYSGTPGDYGKGNLGVGGTIADAAVRKTKLNAEIANGRLAMMAIIGMFFQDGLTGSAWGDWANYTDSPLRAFENENGVQAPVGFWDPVGFTSTGDMAAFKRRREVEIKHGRVAMYAAMGYITPEYFKFDGYLSPSMGIKFSDVPNGLAAISQVPLSGWAQIIAFLGYYELFVNMPVGTEPGNFGKGNLGLGKPVANAELRKKKLNAEIANGRLAMMAIIGMFYQDGLTGSAWGDWALYTDSPLRAFENELGVQAPVGFWDPVGFTADGNVASFRRRRTVELKHGRISMLAAMGYMTPEITGKFPGYLSPSMGLKFADVPNGLAAISKVPAAGWAQIAAYMGAVDVLGGFQDYKTGTPGDYGWKLLTSSDPAEKQVKLAAELANGRLAMIAILAMFFQNGTVGTTGPEMWLPSNNGWNP
ncbi:Light-harvesting complex [Amphidinium carterae]